MKGKVIVIGSIATSLYNFRSGIISNLVKQGYCVVAAAPEMSLDSQEKIAALGARALNIEMSRTGMNPFIDLANAFKLWRMLRKEKPTAVICYTAKPVVYGIVASWLAKVPVRAALITGLGYAFTGGPEVNRRISLWISSFLYRLALKRATTCIFQNIDDQQYFIINKLLSLSTPTGIVNGSGVDIDSFAVAPFPKTPTFLMIARFLKDKGILEFVDASKMLKKSHPNVRVIVVGWRDSSPNSVSQIEVDNWAEQGIENWGKLDDVRSAIATSSVVVLPSYREGTPRSVLEGMSMGRAIITTDVPGCRETVVQGRNGILVPARDSNALLQAMILLAENEEDVIQMGQNSRQLVLEKYELNAVAVATLKLTGLL